MSDIQFDNCSEILLVEGQDDKLVLNRLIEQSGNEISINIQQKGGVERLIKSLDAEVLRPGRKIIGVIADANDDIDSRWQAIRNRLKNADIDLPVKPRRGGVIMPGTPRLGVWLMPDNQSLGELEDFVTSMIPDSDPVWPLVERFVESIPACHREFSEKKMVRAKLYTWLATRKNPGPMAQSIRAKYLDSDSALAQSLIKFLLQLFAG